MCQNYKGPSPNFKAVPVIDGDKEVCLDKEFNIDPRRCIVYSFGIRNEWSFDDSMAWYGCNVYAFDPTMNKQTHKRGNKISFYNIGISNTDGFITIRQQKNCKVMRFISIMEQLLGHDNNNVMIDYLKMDVEGAEVPFLEDVLKNTPHVLQVSLYFTMFYV